MFIIVRLLKENISDEAKGLRSGKNLQAKKSLDRLGVVQREVQASVSEVDRTKRVYFSEESDALEVATKAQGNSCNRRYSSDRETLLLNFSTLLGTALGICGPQQFRCL